MYKRIIQIIAFLSIPFFLSAGDGWHVTLGGSSSLPIGDLQNWFKPGTGLCIGLGAPGARGWQLEGRIEADRFNHENLSGYAADVLELELEHIGLMINGRYRLTGNSQNGGYLNLGAGPHYWKGTRGAVSADSSLGLPVIEKKVLEEGNWAVRLGAGYELRPFSQLGFETSLDYRLVIGSLWPTMQPHIELEGVSGFSTINASFRIRYYF